MESRPVARRLNSHRYGSRDLANTVRVYQKTHNVSAALDEGEWLDYVGYSKLLAEADFFSLDDLKQWILGKSYTQVVTTTFKMQLHPGVTVRRWGGSKDLEIPQ
jgi:hypothetical protein